MLFLHPSAMLLEPIHKSEHARLRSPGEIRVVNMLQTEPGRLSRSPFEIWRERWKCQLLPPGKHQNEQASRAQLTVKDRPPPSACYVNTVVHDRSEDVVQIPLIIIRPPQIPKYSLQTREFRFKGLRKTKFRNLDVRHTGEEILCNLAQEFADTSGSVVEPVGSWVRRRTDGEAFWRFICRAYAFWIARGGGVADAFLRVFEAVDVVGCVRVDGEEVAGACDHVFLFLCEDGEDVAEGVFEDLRVVAVVPLQVGC